MAARGLGRQGLLDPRGEVGRGGDADQAGQAVHAGPAIHAPRRRRSAIAGPAPQRQQQGDPAAHRGADQHLRPLGQRVQHRLGIRRPAADGAVDERPPLAPWPL